MYTGQQYDQETAQYYLRARFYNLVVGRFLQEDVYRGDGLNLYAYCANNPVMYYDPSGYNANDCYGKDGGEPAGDGGTPSGKVKTDSDTNGAAQTTKGNKSFDDGTSDGNKKAKAKTGPKTDGKTHNVKIAEVAASVKDGTVIAGGGTGIPEAVIPTPNGVKSKRRPDILVERADGSQYGINVGKTTAKGAPIKREVLAIYDLEDAGYPMYFVPYDK